MTGARTHAKDGNDHRPGVAGNADCAWRKRRFTPEEFHFRTAIEEISISQEDRAFAALERFNYSANARRTCFDQLHIVRPAKECDGVKEEPGRRSTGHRGQWVAAVVQSLSD